MFEIFWYRRGMIVADRARDEGKFSEAAFLYGRLADRFPEDPGLKILRGNMLKDSQQYAEAKRSYDAALGLQPRNADAHLQLGHLAKIQGDLAEAEANYRRAADLDPGNGAATEELAALAVHRATARADAVTVFRSASVAGLAGERLKIALGKRMK